MGVEIERPLSDRYVKWRGSATSEPINTRGGAGFKLYLPAAFAGSTLAIKGRIDIPHEHQEASELPVSAEYADYSHGAVASPTAGAWHDLTANQLFGLNEVVLVSDSTETCTGKMQIGM